MQYIVYHDKSYEAVDDTTAELLWSKSTQGLKGVEVNGKKYIFSSFSKILDQTDFFAQYPKEIPPSKANPFEDKYGAYGNQQIRRPTEKAKELMKQGFVAYHLGQGRTKEEAEQKWVEFRKSGIDAKLNA